MPYASPEQLVGGPVSPASDVYSLAVVAADGAHRAARRLRAGSRGAGPGGAAGARPGDGHRSRRPLLGRADVRAGADRRPRRCPGRRCSTTPTIENPYKGLRAFGAADAGDFFGRERLVERLIARLGEPGIRGRFVAVVGPSGSGKSSVVRAGPPSGAGARRPADVGGLVPHRDDAGAAPVRAARGGPRVASRRTRRTRCSTCSCSCRRRCAAPSTASSPTTAASCCWSSTSSRSCSPRSTTTRRRGSSTSSSSSSRHRARRAHVVITLRADFYDRPLRPPRPRRAAAGRHRGDHADVDRRARGRHHRPGRRGRRRRRPAASCRRWSARSSTGPAPCRSCSTRSPSCSRPGSAARSPLAAYRAGGGVLADAGEAGRLAARRPRPRDRRDGPPRVPPPGQRRRRRWRRRDPAARPRRRGRGARRPRTSAAGARHVRTAPAADASIATRSPVARPSRSPTRRC